MHPAGLRCSSLTYARYARSSRLAGRAPRRPEWRTYFRTGSYESDAAALEAAVRDHPRVIPLPRSDNRGFAAGVNLAATKTSAPFLLLLNPDTIVEGPVVRELEAWLTPQHDIGVAGARVINVDGSVQPTARRFPDRR